MIGNDMKRLPLKLTLAVLTFFIGVSAVGLWYLLRLESESQQSLSDAISSVTPVKFTVENPCDYPQPRHRELERPTGVIQKSCSVYNVHAGKSVNKKR
jgi:cytoskeletal protein RodZ